LAWIVPPSLPMTTKHLVILLHGLKGFGTDLDILKSKLQTIRSVRVFVPECNHGRTSDGIKSGGERLLNCLKTKLEASNATHLSFVCHGIGGLYARYVLSKLHALDLMVNLTLVHFITIATPHLGSRSKSAGLKSVMAKLWLDQTGKDLMLLPTEDGPPILMDMVEDEYLVVLKLFSNLVSYSCTKRDSVYDYQSSAIRRKSFDKSIEVGEQSPPLLVLDEINHEEKLDINIAEEHMLHRLDILSWKRMALLVPSNQDHNITNNIFWTSKLSKPVISNIVDMIKSSMTQSTSLQSVASENVPLPVHLVVLIHGLDGFATDMEFIATRLVERYPHKIRILAPECNHGKTYDGILLGATRILVCVKNEIKRGDVKYISIIGHSLGGLYGRCLVGLLGKDGIIPNQVTPVNFVTLATPHLGSREHGKILGQQFTSLVVGSAIGLTGKGSL
jgi:triacylglycerol esterase/lipase EstA (alpha/beta hydrolase family)